MSSTLINRVIELTNAERAKAGLGPLTLNNQLARAAQGHSDSMATDDFFDHTGADGSNVGDRVEDAGYVFARTGENIAAGQTTAEQVVEGWMNSPGHRANILNGAYTEIGIGYEYLANDTGSINYNHYWTQVFGTPQGNRNLVNTPQPTQPIEVDNEPAPIVDTNNGDLEPDSQNLATQEPLEPKKPALNNDSPAPQIDELIDREPVSVTEDLPESPIETVDNNANNLESPKQNNNSVDNNSDFNLFGTDMGSLNIDEIDGYGDDLTGSSNNLAMTGGNDATIGSAQQVYSFSSSSSSGSGSNEFSYTDRQYDFSTMTEMIENSTLGTSEFSFNSSELDLINSISNSDLSPLAQQKAIATVESFF